MKRRENMKRQTKRLIALLAGCMMALALCACGGGSGATKSVDYANLSVGDIIPFGGYDCRVLDVQEGKALLITNELVDYQGFYRIQDDPEHPNKVTTESNTTWAECTLREYLNDQFYNAIPEEDRTRILLTHVVTPDHDPDNYFAVEGGDDTEDYIFCLSMEEAYEYFDGLEDRKAVFAEGVGDGQRPWWWLRTPGKGKAAFDGAKTYEFVFVSDSGEIQEYGSGIQYELGVRPAFWINTAE